MIKNEYVSLLREWCDGMLRYQMTHLDDAGIYGGLVCPACCMIHGRCHNAIFPYLYMAGKTGEQKYADAAARLIQYAKFTVCTNGGFINDTMNEWHGITTFAVAAMVQSLDFSHLLNETSRVELYRLTEGALEFLYGVFDRNHGNINYLAGLACALELGGKFFENYNYRIKARACAHELLTYITESGLIAGEGGMTRRDTSPKSCKTIDIGYNIEETICLMAHYAISAEDDIVLDAATSAAEAHMGFLLPDGGWDNSFGSRMDKWTYWGSRTSDGCQYAYIALSRHNPDLARAAHSNFRLMRSYTHNGLLYGGRDLLTRGEPPCIHHTFTHAAGLASALVYMDDTGFCPPDSAEPADVPDKYYAELDTYVCDTGLWRATVTGYDCGKKVLCHPSGGALCLLYHRGAGPLLVSSMSEFRRYEIVNTQRHLHCEDTPLTMRLQIGSGKMQYANILDKSAKIRRIDSNIFEVSGHITDKDGNSPFDTAIKCTALYDFSDNEAVARFTYDGRGACLVVPIIAAAEDRFETDGCVCRIIRDDCCITLTANQPVSVSGERWFNHVPGFEAIPVMISDGCGEITIGIRLTESAG